MFVVREDNGLLSGGLAGESEYLGWEILVAWPGVARIGVVTLTERIVNVWD